MPSQVCQQHCLPKALVCLHPTCQHSFTLCCLRCKKEKHAAHPNRLVTVSNLQKMINNNSSNLIEDSLQRSLINFKNKMLYIRNFRVYILEKEADLMNFSKVIKGRLESITNEKDNIANLLEELTTNNDHRKLDTALQKCKQIINFNPMKSQLTFSNPAIKQHKIQLQKQIKNSTTLLNDMREYLIKIIEVLLSVADEEQEQQEEEDIIVRSSECEMSEDGEEEMFIKGNSNNNDILSLFMDDNLILTKEVDMLKEEIEQKTKIYEKLINRDSALSIVSEPVIRETLIESQISLVSPFSTKCMYLQDEPIKMKKSGKTSARTNNINLRQEALLDELMQLKTQLKEVNHAHQTFGKTFQKQVQQFQTFRSKQAQSQTQTQPKILKSKSREFSKSPHKLSYQEQAKTLKKLNNLIRDPHDIVYPKNMSANILSMTQCQQIIQFVSNQQSQKRKLKQQLSLKERQLMKVKERNALELREREREIQDLERERDALEGKIGEGKREIEKMKEEEIGMMEESQQRVGRMEVDYEKVKKRGEEVQGLLDEAQGKISKLNQQKQRNTEQIRVLDLKLSQSKNNILSSQKQIQQTHTKLTELKRQQSMEVEMKEQQIKQLESNNAELVKNVERLKEEIQVLKEEAEGKKQKKKIEITENSSNTMVISLQCSSTLTQQTVMQEMAVSVTPILTPNDSTQTQTVSTLNPSSQTQTISTLKDSTQTQTVSPSNPSSQTQTISPVSPPNDSTSSQTVHIMITHQQLLAKDQELTWLRTRNVSLLLQNHEKQTELKDIQNKQSKLQKSIGKLKSSIEQLEKENRIQDILIQENNQLIQAFESNREKLQQEGNRGEIEIMDSLMQDLSKENNILVAENKHLQRNYKKLKKQTKKQQQILETYQQELQQLEQENAETLQSLDKKLKASQDQLDKGEKICKEALAENEILRIQNQKQQKNIEERDQQIENLQMAAKQYQTKLAVLEDKMSKISEELSKMKKEVQQEGLRESKSKRKQLLESKVFPGKNLSNNITVTSCPNLPYNFSAIQEKLEQTLVEKEQLGRTIDMLNKQNSMLIKQKQQLLEINQKASDAEKMALPFQKQQLIKKYIDPVMAVETPSCQIQQQGTEKTIQSPQNPSISAKTLKEIKEIIINLCGDINLLEQRLNDTKIVERICLKQLDKRKAENKKLREMLKEMNGFDRTYKIVPRKSQQFQDIKPVHPFKVEEIEKHASPLKNRINKDRLTK